jgi:hypothetical protein
MHRQEASVEGLPFPKDVPESMKPSRVEPVKFDPKVHLQLEIPEGIKMLLNGDPNFCDECVFPAAPTGSAENPGLAYTKPFRVLSAEGVRAMREVIFAHENKSFESERVPKLLRGLGYFSDFVRDFTYCPELLGLLGKCAGDDLWPHDMHMNIAQINFGQIGESRKVDQWHLDSVPYVMVLLLSDGNDMVGGELQVARIDDPQDALRQVQSNSVSPEQIDTVRYPDAGYAIFMQGSRIAHSVTPVEFAREPRLTLVNSYQPLNPFAPCKTVYRTFKYTDPDEVHPSEITRHYAWRVQGQLQKLIRNPMWGDTESIQQLLKNAAEELQHARALVTGEKEDESPYAVDKTKNPLASWKAKTPVAKL